MTLFRSGCYGEVGLLALVLAALKTTVMFPCSGWLAGWLESVKILEPTSTGVSEIESV